SLRKKMLNRLEDVFKSFQKHDVKYLVIGGIAAVLHGVPRATFDLDILIEATPNCSMRYWMPALGQLPLRLLKTFLQMKSLFFRDKVRIDVQTSTPGITFEKAWENRKIVNYNGQSFTSFLSRI
ncbi:MAG: hypothetical protein QXH80_03565, partial [Candidatus Nanoarchaeia archaeon]